MIAQSIKWHIEELGTDPGEIAILYRTNAQSRPLEDALRKIGYIPESTVVRASTTVEKLKMPSLIYVSW